MERRESVDDETCAICMNPLGSAEGRHRCTTCAAEAWRVCSACDEKLAGKPQSVCPICRAEYAYVPAAWESLPETTVELLLHAQPSQRALVRIAARFAALEHLLIQQEEPYPADEDEEVPALDFAASELCFPALTRLELAGVALSCITLTEANVPRLEHLSLHSVTGDCCPFHLALPQLVTLSAEHMQLQERADGVDAGQFGLSLSRCPKLEQVCTHRLLGLGADNFCLLPRCVDLRLNRAADLSQLDILFAPALNYLSLLGDYHCRDLRIRHLPHTTLADITRIHAALRQAEEKAREAARTEERKWRSGEKGTNAARALSWIGKKETFCVAASSVMPGPEGNAEHEELLRHHVRRILEQETKVLRRAVVLNALGSSVRDETLPPCEVEVLNGPGPSLSLCEVWSSSAPAPTLPPTPWRY